ncbi:hypothetical protein HD554DRAFT_2042468 [Boletus coccyginus]|nr:hypothetical protein HD554DRAFT_2042468 [Boletus coccyginus]
MCINQFVGELDSDITGGDKRKVGYYARLISSLDLPDITVTEYGHCPRSRSTRPLPAGTPGWREWRKAVVLAQEALDLCPQGHLDRSDLLNNLAHHLCHRCTPLMQLKDKERVFSLYTQLAHVPQIVSIDDLSAVRAWIRTAQVDAFSTCLRECAPAHGVELLEQGRGVFWSQLTRIRSPLDLVTSVPARKTLPNDFTRLALLIRNALNSPGANQHGRLCHLNVDMHRVVTKIRDLPGLSRFLLPPLSPALQRAAIGGPVIIVDASEYSCGALIVLLDRNPVHIPLQITREGVRDLSTEPHTLAMRAKTVDMTREPAAFLRKLWDQIIWPIVDFLQTIHPAQSRIWWCHTAEFSVLLLHAVGPYRRGRRNLTDICISSYTPLLTALIRTTRRDPSSAATQRERFITIGQAKAIGESELVPVGAELDKIGQNVDGLATFTRIDGEESRISRVVEELGKNDWVHLACHGLPDPKKPFESAFALRDGHFTTQRIIGCDLKNPEFAYFSAYHTTV